VIPESGRGKRVMNLLNPNSLRVHFLESEAKNLALRIFMNIRDSSSPAAPLQKLDELLVSFEQFRPGGPEGVLPAFCAPGTSSALSILDPRRGSIE
jgi:hypothetical protein